jgi:S-adenosylmethionine hydrolase
MAATTRPIVTLTTDFGGGSPYVAQIKAVMLSRNPELHLVDVTHDVRPQDIRGGAVVVDDVCRRFPPRTIHIAVIDPGVGTQRELVFARIGQHDYLAPDNGLLTLAARRENPDLVIAITNRLYFLPEVSPTFHGRDILAPVAAHLSLGLHPERLGRRIEALVMLPVREPTVAPRQITGAVVQIDPFGNIITDITELLLPVAAEAPGLQVRLRGAQVQGIVRTYGDRPPGTLVALVGSSGRLEIAVVNGHAAERIGACLDDEVCVAW